MITVRVSDGSRAWENNLKFANHEKIDSFPSFAMLDLSFLAKDIDMPRRGQVNHIGWHCQLY